MIDSKAREERRKARIFAKNRPDIENIIHNSEHSKGNFSKRKIHEREPTWKEGTRSLTKGYSVEGGGIEEDSGFNRYLAKIVPPRHIADSLTELASLDQENPAVSRILAPLAGHKVIDRSHLFVLELLKHVTLDERYHDDLIIPPNELVEIVEPCISLNNFKKDSEEVKNIEAKLKELSDEYLPGKPLIGKLDQLATEDYVRKFMKYLSLPKEISKRKRKEIRANFRDLTEKYLTNPELQRLIQHDGYPWNHLGVKLVDAGDVKIGSVAMQLGCLLGNPSIFDKLFYDPRAYPLNTNKQENARECIREVTHHYANALDLDPKTVERGTYVGGIYGNIRLLIAKDFGDLDKQRFRRAALEQLTILKKYEKSAGKLRRHLFDLGWKI